MVGNFFDQFREDGNSIPQNDEREVAEKWGKEKKKWKKQHKKNKKEKKWRKKVVKELDNLKQQAKSNSQQIEDVVDCLRIVAQRPFTVSNDIPVLERAEKDDYPR